jgi:hypothetical protein
MCARRRQLLLSLSASPLHTGATDLIPRGHCWGSVYDPHARPTMAWRVTQSVTLHWRYSLGTLLRFVLMLALHPLSLDAIVRCKSHLDVKMHSDGSGWCAPSVYIATFCIILLKRVRCAPFPTLSVWSLLFWHGLDRNATAQPPFNYKTTSRMVQCIFFRPNKFTAKLWCVMIWRCNVA